MIETESDHTWHQLESLFRPLMVAQGTTKHGIVSETNAAVGDEPIGSLGFRLGCVRCERSAILGTIRGAWIKAGPQVRVTLHSASANASVPTETIVIERGRRAVVLPRSSPIA